MASSAVRCNHTSFGGHDMLNFQQHQEGLHLRLFATGIPRYLIPQLAELFCKWESCSGIEWTIKRLKSLKIDFIRMKAGLDPISRIRKNSRGKIWGPIGSLFRYGLGSERAFARSIQVLMAYSYYVFPKLTEPQKDKFLKAVNSTDNEDNTYLYKYVASFSRAVIGVQPLCKSPSPLITYEGSPSKRAPLPLGGSVPQNTLIHKDLQVFSDMGVSEVASRYPRIFTSLLKGLPVWRRTIQSNGYLEVPWSSGLIGGEVHFLQEPGGKLRSVASPYRIFQMAMKPFGDALYKIVKGLPWDCTFDQSKAIPMIKSHLLQGGTIHSVDLSSATDMFPLRLQVEIARAIFQKHDWDYIDFFVDLSRSTWLSEIGRISWKKGQPLGLYPSFAIFTLSHGLLLRYLENNLGLQGCFYVVGDDVVILNDSLYSSYIDVLEKIGCPYSPDKTISSSELCEFAGKIITSSSVIPQMKWRKVSDDNFLDLARLMGRRFRSLLTVRQKRVYDQVAHLCEPIGLNQSLPGDNLQTMIERTLNFYRPEEVVLKSLMGLRKKIYAFAYSSGEYMDNREVSSILSTFDEKVAEVLKKTVFSRWEIAVTILDGLSSLPEGLGLTPRLPLLVRGPSRTTTLKRYEHLLANRK